MAQPTFITTGAGSAIFATRLAIQVDLGTSGDVGLLVQTLFDGSASTTDINSITVGGTISGGSTTGSGAGAKNIDGVITGGTALTLETQIPGVSYLGIPGNARAGRIAGLTLTGLQWVQVVGSDGNAKPLILIGAWSGVSAISAGVLFSQGSYTLSQDVTTTTNDVSAMVFHGSMEDTYTAVATAPTVQRLRAPTTNQIGGLNGFVWDKPGVAGTNTMAGTFTGTFTPAFAGTKWLLQGTVATDTSPPDITSLSATGGTLTGTGGFTSNEAGTSYWQVNTSATLLTIPTSPAAMTGWTSRAMTAGAQTFNLGALAAGSGYYLHQAFQDSQSTPNRTTTDIVSGPFTVSAAGTAPNITVQPTNQSVVAGSTATFSVTATGSSLTYQWRRNGTNISGATSSTFTTTATTVTGGAYNNGDLISVVVTGDTAPAATSNNATLTVSTGGTYTSEVLKSNNGTVVANQALNYVALYNNTTGALVVRQTGLSTNASGIFVVTSALITPGTTYKVDWETASGQRRMPVKVAT